MPGQCVRWLTCLPYAPSVCASGLGRMVECAVHRMAAMALSLRPGRVGDEAHCREVGASASWQSGARWPPWTDSEASDRELENWQAVRQGRRAIDGVLYCRWCTRAMSLAPTAHGRSHLSHSLVLDALGVVRRCGRPPSFSASPRCVCECLPPSATEQAAIHINRRRGGCFACTRCGMPLAVRVRRAVAAPDMFDLYRRAGEQLDGRRARGQRRPCPRLSRVQRRKM